MSGASSVREYLATLPADRKKAISTVRDVIRKNLPAGFEEGMQFGMIGYYVPLSRYPDTYNGRPLPIAALASQKGFMAVYLMSVYGDPATRAWFEKAYRASGKKLDMGKSCVRFATLDDLPLDLIGEAIANVDIDTFLARYEQSRGVTLSAPKKTKAANTKKTKAATAKAPAKRR